MHRLVPDTPDQCSTPNVIHITLYLHIFQGEPAISRYDSHITPNRSSSEHLAAYTGSDLPPMLLEVHPGHG